VRLPVVSGLAVVLLLLGVMLLAAPGPTGRGLGADGRAQPAASAVARPSVAAAPDLGQPDGQLLDDARLAPALSAELSGLWLGTTAFGTASVDTVAVGFRERRLVVRGTALAGWTLLPLDLTGSVVASSGRVRVRIDEGYLADTDLPGSARREIERALQGGIDRWLVAAGPTAPSVAVGPDRLVVVERPFAARGAGQSGSGAGTR
jgi:hypothetical protein